MYKIMSVELTPSIKIFYHNLQHNIFYILCQNEFSRMISSKKRTKEFF